MRTTRAAVAAGAILIGLLGSSGIAMAAPGGGATVSRSSSCNSFPPLDVCIDSMSVFNVTRTPSGNVLVVSNSSFSYAISQNGQVLLTNTTSEQRHTTTLAPGETHVIHQQLTAVTEQFGVTCTLAIRLQEANGQVQYSES